MPNSLKCKIKHLCHNGTITESERDRILKALEQEKMGRWEWVQYDYNPKLGNWHCSECRCVVIECVGKKEKGGIPSYKYCPQCGTKMESEEKENG